MKSLKEIFNKYECDKGSLKHRYDRVYEPILSHLRDQEFTMIEIGVFKGISLQAWVEYFPKAHFIGLDVFTRINPEQIPILNHPRVIWFKCDSTKKLPENLIKTIKDGVDVIIDDGKHTHTAQYDTFKNFIPFLKKEGIYFIEDVWPFDRMTTQEKSTPWLTKRNDRISDKHFQRLLKLINNYLKTFHDLRNGYQPDTFIVEVRK